MARDDDTANGAAPGTGRRMGLTFWKRACLASLAVNVLVLGVIGGALLKGPPPPPGGKDRIRDLSFGPFAGALEQADRDALRLDFMARSDGGQSLRDGLRRDMEAVLHALRATPFDPAALEAALAAQGARFSDQMGLGRQLLRDRIVALTPEARLRFADRLEDSLTRHGPGGHKGQPGP